MSDIPHQTKIKIIERLVKPDSLSVKTWGREVKVLNFLLATYPDVEFWLKHDLTFMLHSLAWFKTADGAAALKTNYSVFHFTFDPAPPNSVDTKPELRYDTSIQTELAFGAPEA